MFSVLKKITGKNESNSSGLTNSSHRIMSSSLQKKFSKGVRYNMKILIKGDRQVGKTSLFYRIQGKNFITEYIPTEEIQVACIHWNCLLSDDIIKVEVWDIVDKGKKKKQFEGLKIQNDIEVPPEAALDAEFLDIYNGTNGVILMMDLTKPWTFDYIKRELPTIPDHIPIIILGNCCDLISKKVIASDSILLYIQSLNKKRSSLVRYCESSMKNGFGLKLLHKFLNLPFLQLQKETILKQLKENEEKLQKMTNELDISFNSEDASYSKFLDNYAKHSQESNSESPSDKTSTSLTQLQDANLSENCFNSQNIQQQTVSSLKHSQHDEKQNFANFENSDSDSETKNPLVSELQDDFVEEHL